jgi:predicted NAD-dependent protein-ADP-ribosyltransferase YbiA (DUF1768 family)
MNYVYFNSGAAVPLNKLSNLNRAPVVLTAETITPALLAVNAKLSEWVRVGEPLHFGTIEHLWHALKALDRDTFIAFTESGRFGRFDATVFAEFFPGNGVAKHAYWAKKQNSGIIPKLASNRKYGVRLGVGKSLKYERERNQDNVQRAVWRDLLTRKYVANKLHRDTLLSTGDKTLVEFEKGSTLARPSFWGGCVRDGTVVGENFMGQMLQEVRSKLKEQSTE